MKMTRHRVEKLRLVWIKAKKDMEARPPGNTFRDNLVVNAAKKEFQDAERILKCQHIR